MKFKRAGVWYKGKELLGMSIRLEDENYRRFTKIGKKYIMEHVESRPYLESILPKRKSRIIQATAKKKQGEPFEDPSLEKIISCPKRRIFDKRFIKKHNLFEYTDCTNFLE